ncbi:MAG: excinuclease ABC subunit UvrC [Vicinamibacterales bacterium]
MGITQLKGQIGRLPEQPGVYLFSNEDGETLYVGKARVLRDRVRNYLAPPTSPRHAALQAEAAALEVVVTDSVVEALALENHLIKQREPKFNILLRDDKNYPYLQLTTGEAFPRLLVARQVERDGHYYAGPFLPATLARRTMSLAHRLFGIRSCNEVITGGRERPCLEFDIHRCLAPCVASLCPPEAYGLAVADARLFLDGRNDELLADLQERMTTAADAERFEQAAQLRDAMRTVQTLRDRQQKMASVTFGDRDALAVKKGPAGAVVQVFQVRHGKVVDRVELVTDQADVGESNEADLLEAALTQFYEARTAPPEIHLSTALESGGLVEEWLSGREGRRVALVVPKRGDKRGLVDLAARNAAIAYDRRFNEEGTPQREALDGLREALGLPTLPRRIECFDISTIQGSETVASMVVCEQGRMKRADYRKFRVRGAAAGHAPVRRILGAREMEPDASPRILDDFASMHEVVGRRYARVLEQADEWPDLIVIDGGKGQLGAAYAALEALGLDRLVAIGLAKQEELVFTRDRAEPLALPRDSPALLLLQRIRDEAHRFAVTFHRGARTRRDLRSALDDVPGVGPRRRRALLTRFGSVANVRRATREELCTVVGTKAADAVLAHFGRQ